MSSFATLTRRDLVKAGIACAVSAGAWPVTSESARAAGGTINFADIGVGDPGDWSLFTKANSWNVNLVAIGNAPSAILNVLVAGGGTASYDVINIVGGMQKPLVDNDLIEALDTARIPGWGRDRNIAEFLAKGTPGFNFIGYEDKLYGAPTVLQGDSFRLSA
jgi:spermidine/putrescine-binding protein